MVGVSSSPPAPDRPLSIETPNQLWSNHLQEKETLVRNCNLSSATIAIFCTHSWPFAASTLVDRADIVSNSLGRPMLTIFVYCIARSHMERFVYRHLAWLYYGSGLLFRSRRTNPASTLGSLQSVLSTWDDLFDEEKQLKLFSLCYHSICCCLFFTSNIIELESFV